MKLVAGLFWTIAVFAVLGAVISWSPVSSDSPKSPTQTPSIKTEKQVEDSSKGENQTDAHAKYGSVSSESLNASGAATEGHEQPEKRTEKTSEFWTIGSRTLKITDTLLVVFTFFLFLATVALWRATRDLVDDAKETSERQLRAYVYLEMSAFQWPFPPKNSDRWGIVVKITNSGQTWARNVVIRRAKISKERRRPYRSMGRYGVEATDARANGTWAKTVGATANGRYIVHRRPKYHKRRPYYLFCCLGNL